MITKNSARQYGHNHRAFVSAAGDITKANPVPFILKLLPNIRVASQESLTRLNFVEPVLWSSSGDSELVNHLPLV